MKTFVKLLFAVSFYFSFVASVYSQDTLLVEDFGVPVGAVPIAAYTGWDNKMVSYEGSASMRCLGTTAACSAAIQTGNVLIAGGQYFQVSKISSKGDGSLSINFMMYNRYATATNDSLKFYISNDNKSWQECSLYQFSKFVGWASQQIEISSPVANTFYF